MAATDVLGAGIILFPEVQLPDGWAFEPLGNRCTIRRGSSPRPAGDPRYFGGGTIPWIKIGDATKTGSRYIESTEEFVNERGADCSVRIPPESLIIANSGVSLGFAAITRMMGCIHDGWLLPTDFRGLDRDYLYYCINVATGRIRSLADGTTQPNLNTDIARRIVLPFPPLPEQKRIAHILGTLDDKIELNRRMNATLEGISRAIFKSWFVDFDPVRQKAAGKQPVGMDAQTAAMFPDSFEESEIGEVPKRWTTCTLDDYTQVVIGGDWGASEPSSEAPAACLCVRGADIPSLQAGGVGKLPTRYLKPASLEKRRLMPWDLVVEISGGSPTQSTGRPVLVTDGLLARLSSPLIASNFCRILKLKEKEHSPFIYFYLRHLYDGDEFLQYENGTTGIKNFAYTLFAARHPMLAPDHRALAAFAAAITPTVTLHQQKARESDSLAALRDTLLPKLLSGEIRVSKAEEAVDEAIA